MTGRVALRPMTPADLDLLEEELSSEGGTGVYEWFGFTSISGLRRQLAHEGLLGPDGGMLAVVDAASGEAVGRVSCSKSSWGRPDTSWCWTTAGSLRPSSRGLGLGTEMQRLLVEYLFLHTRAERLQAYTDVQNKAAQRVLEKVGYLREGVLRSAQWRSGGWHDQLLHSILRGARAPSGTPGPSKP